MKYLILLLFASPCFAMASDTTKIVVYEGTQVSVMTKKELNGKELQGGDVLEFVLAENVLQQGVVVFKEGWRVTGTVTEAAKAKALGKKGKLEFSIDFLYLPNGRPVKLRSTVKRNLQGSGGAVAAGAILLSPVALLFNGKQAKFAEGTVFTAYVDQDFTFN